MTNGNKEVGAKSFNKDVFFSLWFYLIKICCHGVDVCRDDQGIANKEKKDGENTLVTNRTNTDMADGANAPDTDRADVKKADETDPPNIGRANWEEVERANGPNIDRTNVAKVDRVD